MQVIGIKDNIQKGTGEAFSPVKGAVDPEVQKFIEYNIEDIEVRRWEEVALNAYREMGEAGVHAVQDVLELAGITDCCLAKYIPFGSIPPGIHQIKCYNVGFGDCFLCKAEHDNGAKMLVDFGAAENFKAVKGDLINEFSCASQKYLMLSHLHRDHYSGLSKTTAKRDKKQLQFDEVYLSDYIASGGIEFAGAVLLSTANKTLLNLVKSILKIPALLSGYVTNGTKVYLLCQGNVVSNSLCKLEVLLPLRTNRFYVKQSGAPEELLGLFAQRYKELIRYSPSADTESASIQVYSDNLEENIEKLISWLMKEGKEINKTISESEIKERFKYYHNSLSLAFHELSVEDAKNVLFLGDAEPTDVDALVKADKITKEYCFVKVPHHGTKDYFYNALPTAKYYAIPNGGSRANWALTALYDTCYGGNATFICSNSCNCELIQYGVLCQSKSKNNATCGIKPLSKTIAIS